MANLCFEVLYWTGIREGELLALTSANIDFDNKLIDINKTYQRLQSKDIITTPKTRKSKRKVPIPAFLCDELREFISTRYMITHDERLFPITKSYLSHEMIRGCKNTGVKKIRIHDIRHSHASPLINQGCDALILAGRLGHEKVSTTLNTYSHLFPHKQQELVNNLEQLATAASVTPTPEPLDGNPLFEAAGIACNTGNHDTADTSTANVIAPNLPYVPAPLTKNKTSAKIIQMPQRNII